LDNRKTNKTAAPCCEKGRGGGAKEQNPQKNEKRLVVTQLEGTQLEQKERRGGGRYKKRGIRKLKKKSTKQKELKKPEDLKKGGRTQDRVREKGGLGTEHG